MKKLFMVLSLCALMVGQAYAALTIDAKAKITLTAGTKQSELMILEASALNDGLNSGYYSVINTERAIGLYAIVGNGHYDTYGTKSLTGTYLGFWSNGSTNYTLRFSQVSGSLKIYDYVAMQLITLSATTPAYTFTVEANADKTEFNTRFQIVDEAPTYTVTTNINGWATYSNSLDLVAASVAAGVTEPVIYSALYDGAETLALTEQNGVKANTGVVVWGDPLTTYTLVPGTVTEYTSDLLASVTETTLDAGNTNYCLTTINGVSAFYEYTGEKVKANKAYLSISASAAPQHIRLRIAAVETDVENVVENTVAVEKVIRNGQVLIQREGCLYNLQGQLVK